MIMMDICRAPAGALQISKLFREIKSEMEKTDNDLTFFKSFMNTFTTTGRIDQ